MTNAIMKALAAKKAREAALATTNKDTANETSQVITKPESAQQVSAQTPLSKEIKKQAETEVASRKVQQPISADLIAKLAALRKVNLDAPTKAAINNAATNTDTGGITYNAAQNEFVTLASSGKSGILIGAAGTGKTTCSKGAMIGLINSGLIPIIDDTKGHKHLRAGAHGLVITSFTRRAVANIRRVQSEDLKQCCMTLHKLLEYGPFEEEIFDTTTGQYKTIRGFRPYRDKENKLPNSIKTIIIEEASMVSVALFNELLLALPDPANTQFIFIGDIQQLPPVFGSAILGFKMLELPTVELTEVYRQALESPIIKLAHRILSGKPIPVEEFTEWEVPNKLKLHPWKKKLSAEDAALTLAKFFTTAIDNGQYDIEEDIILIPYNKACGTLEVNKRIANHIARKNNRMTYEIKAGFEMLYFSEEDKVLYDKEDAIIQSIEPNPEYSGERVQPASTNLDYWGYNPNAAEESLGDDSDNYGLDAIDIDLILSNAASASDSDSPITRAASHIITLFLPETERTVTISSAGDINKLIHGYALTVHKSQGSEWRKVFVCLHTSHNTMLQRELLYTAVTRAREELYVICEPDSFVKGIVKQRITGNTLAEKAEFFKGKLEN